MRFALLLVFLVIGLAFGFLCTNVFLDKDTAIKAPPGMAEKRDVPPPVSGDVSVYFSPKGGCSNAVVSVLSEAKDSVLVQAYSFTSEPISQALIACKNRGVKVRVIVDRDQYGGKGAVAGPLSDAGIEVLIDAKHPIAHNKVMIIDGSVVVTGSYNFTKQAESNAENLLVIRDPSLAQKYLENWELHHSHSVQP